MLSFCKSTNKYDVIRNLQNSRNMSKAKLDKNLVVSFIFEDTEQAAKEDFF